MIVEIACHKCGYLQLSPTPADLPKRKMATFECFNCHFILMTFHRDDFADKDINGEKVD